MKIGVPKEIKPQENRIGLTPDSAKILISNGHEVLVENNGGFEAGFYNEQYKLVGAKIVNKAEDIFSDSDIIVKVKEPLLNEVKMKLTEKEVNTIIYLSQSSEAVSVQDLEKNVWQYQPDIETHTVETHIYRLRKKILKNFKDNNFIMSKKNGYQIN